jgi:hypothetical protein
VHETCILRRASAILDEKVEVRLVDLKPLVEGGNGGTSASSLESALECIGYAKSTGTAKYTDHIKGRGYVMCVGYERGYGQVLPSQK